MTPEEKEIVQSTWKMVVPIADTAADLFYDKLFELDPSLKPLFANVDLDAQKKKLLQALATTVSSLDTLDALVPVLTELGRRHASYGVIDAHYDTVASALLWTLETGLGDAWTPAARQAWTTAYTIVADTMKAGARNDDQPAFETEAEPTRASTHVSEKGFQLWQRVTGSSACRSAMPRNTRLIWRRPNLPLKSMALASLFAAGATWRRKA